MFIFVGTEFAKSWVNKKTEENMKKFFIIFLVLACALTSVFAQGSQESSASYPTGAIELVALGSAGGGSDVLARNITEVVTNHNLCPQPVNVVDKAGGGGAVGMAYFNAKKDVDYNLMTINSTHCLLIHTTDVAAPGGKWTPIACVATDEQTLVVRNESPFQSWADVEKAIKAAPGSLTVGCCDDMDAMTLNILESSTGVKFNHTAYFASSEIFNALLGGHIDFAIANPAEVVGLVEGGRARVIGTFSPKRLSGQFASAPTFTEIGYPACQVQMIRGIVGPGGMSREVQLYWSEILKKVCETEDWKNNYINKNFLGSTYMGADEFSAFLEQHEANLVDFAKANGIEIIK